MGRMPFEGLVLTWSRGQRKPQPESRSHQQQRLLQVRWNSFVAGCRLTVSLSNGAYEGKLLRVARDVSEMRQKLCN